MFEVLISMTIPEVIGVEPKSHEEAYLPYVAAVRKGLPRLDEAALQSPIDAALAIQNGRMPEQGGVVELDPVRGIVGAFDLVVAQRRGKQLEIRPGIKTAVDERTDTILEVGALTLTRGEAEIRLVGFAEQSWALGRPVVRMLGIDALHYDIEEVDDSGVVKTIERIRYY